MARYYEVNALIEFIKQHTPTINGETTMECVERAIREAPTADVVPKSEVEKIEKESSAFAEIIHKQEDEIQQLRKSLLTKQALEEEFSKSVKKIEKQALKTIEKAKQEVAREIFEEIDNKLHDMAVEYHNAGHSEYFAVCEVIHHKVIRPVEKKYTESEGKE